jgi:endoglucanase
MQAACSSTTPSSSSTLSSAPPSSRPTDSTSFHVSGNKVVETNGTQFVPYGFVFECLASTTLACEKPSGAEPVTDTDRIKVAARYWHANTIRLQVSQEHLFSRTPYNSSYLNQLDREVALVNRLGMVAIVTLQEEEFDGPPLPTESASRFWAFMATHFKHDQMVMFDLYNEPRLKPYEGETWMWNIWRNGGSVDMHGVDETFVGMQSLVNQIRGEGAQNVIVAEGNRGDHDLSDLPGFLLRGTNIAYGMEPDLTPTTDSPAQWDAAYGHLSATVPIMMEAFQDYATAGTCFTDSPTVLPELLSYLHSHQLGLLSWTLNPGNMMVGENPEQPTSYVGATTQICVPHNKKHQVKRRLAGEFSLSTNTNGPGQTILNFFRANSRPVSGQ